MLIDTPEKFQERFDVSRETIDRFTAYHALLCKWNDKINLVSKTTLHNVWHRHFADSAQLWALIPDSARYWLDVGTGAGFPGLVGAIIAKEKSPDMSFTLVDSDQRKVAFLAAVVREVDLKVTLLPSRIDSIPPRPADVISARALAPLSKLIEMTRPNSNESTCFLFQKGQNYKSELTEARKVWHIEPEIIPSMTDANAVILRIKGDIRAI